MGQVINITARSPKIVARPDRAEAPEDVKRAMDDWRLAGCWSDVPSPYRAWQLQLASMELDRIAEEYHLEIINDPRIVDEGWLDGMKVMQVDVLTRTMRKRRLVWCDSNQGFMVRMDSGGQGCIFESDLA